MDNFFKELRTKYQLTQKQFSEITGVPVRTLQNWESGVNKPPAYIKCLINIAEQAGVFEVL